MKFAKISNELVREGQPNTSHKKEKNFLVTIFISLVGCLFAIYFIIMKISPNTQWVILLLILIGYSANVIFASIIYLLAKPKQYETDRELFRRCFKKGAVLGVLLVLVLIIQWQLKVV